MADTKILNLDEFIAEQPERKIIWRGQQHQVAGLTGEAYLRFLQAKGALERAKQKDDEAAQWEQNLVIVGLLVPSLVELRAELLGLKLVALNKLVAFIMAEMSEETPTGEAGVDAAPGESTSPV